MLYGVKLSGIDDRFKIRPCHPQVKGGDDSISGLVLAGNVDAARRYSRFAVDKGYIPVAPHLLFPQFLDDADPDERKLGIFFGNAIMSKCSEVWVFGSRISAGMQAEIRRAKWKNYRLRYFTEDCQEV